MSTISTTLTLVDNFSSTFNKIVNKLKAAQGQGGFGGFAAKAVGALSKIHPAVNAVSSAMDILKPVVGAVTGAFNQLGASIDNCIQAYQFQSEQELALETIMRQRMGATEKEIQSIKDFAAAEQEAGIYGDELILAGAQELATFVSDTEALKTLSKAMNHMIAQHDKYNATAQTFITSADMIGKVMAGQTGALSKNGWVFSEEEKQMLKTGTEMERAATLAKIITDNVTEMNYVLAGTDAGSMQRLSNTIGDLQENIGKNLQPIKSSWVNLMNGFRADWLKMVDKVTKTIAPFMQSFINGVQAIVNLVKTLLSPFLKDLGKWIDNAIGKPIRMLTKIFNAVFIPIVNTATKVIKSIQNAFQYVADSIKSIFDPTRTWWQNYIGKAVAYMKAIYNVSIKPLIMKIVNPVVNMFNKVKSKFDSMINTIKDKVGGVFKEIKFEDHLLKILKGVFFIKNAFVGIFNTIIGVVKFGLDKVKNTFLAGLNAIIQPVFGGIEWLASKLGMKDWVNMAASVKNAFAGSFINPGTIKFQDYVGNEFAGIVDKSIDEANKYMDRLRKEVEGNTKELDKNKKATTENTNELKISDEWKNLLSEAAHRQFNLNYNQVTPSIHIDDVTINRDADSENFFSKVTDSIEQATGAIVAYS